ncbi:hypothetical protein [Acetobacter syzygii]|nr:hypothetical protein [Acetobacter syzygii]
MQRRVARLFPQDHPHGDKDAMLPASIPLRSLLAIIGLPVLACLLAVGIGASLPITTVLVGLAAACAAGIVAYAPTPQPVAAPVADKPVTPTATAPQPDPKLRHDIRGIISPAMLAAEQLSLMQDPTVQKAAETINDSLDRLTARLKQRPPL